MTKLSCSIYKPDLWFGRRSKLLTIGFIAYNRLLYKLGNFKPPVGPSEAAPESLSPRASATDQITYLIHLSRWSQHSTVDAP